ncbi:MAG: dynamin family protein [Micromonosporaceae bacterium]|nr:dynamin family protein [Micromonosporaceae bacterium]
MSQVLAHADEVHDLAQGYGHEDLASILAAEVARWKESVATVVVAGAQKRGKSRLVNALLGQPGLLPVDVDIATSTYLSIQRGASLAVTAHRRIGDHAETIDILPSEIADYASATGDPSTRGSTTGVDIATEHPVLEGLRLVDTPGIDSLTIGHRHTTMAVVRQADALLFTLSAQDQPVLRHELEFLAEVSSGIGSVAFVMTKVEDSVAWRELVTENQRRLAAFIAHLPDGSTRETRYRRLLTAPWIPVSSRLAEASALRQVAGRSDRAKALWARSGMPSLVAHLAACASGKEEARCARVLACTRRVLDSLTLAEQDRMAAAARGEGGIRDRLAEVEATLAELSKKARQRRRFTVEQHFVGREIGALVRDRLSEIRRPYDQAIAGLTSRKKIDCFLTDLPDSMERSLEAAWVDLLCEVHTRTAERLTRLLDTMGLDPIDLELTAMSLPFDVGERLTALEPPAGRRFDLVREGVPGITMAASLANVLNLALSALGSVAGPIALVVGPAVAAGFAVRRRQWEQAGRDQAGIRQSLAEVFTRSTAEIAAALERLAAEWRIEAEQRVDETLARQRREHERRKAELSGIAARDTTKRAETAADAERRLETIATLRFRGADLDATIETMMDTPGSRL